MRKLVPFHSLPSTNHGRFTCLPEVSAHLIVDQLMLRRSMLRIFVKLQLHLEEAESIPGGPSDLLQNILHIFALLGRFKVKKVLLKTMKLIKLPFLLLFWSFLNPEDRQSHILDIQYPKMYDILDIWYPSYRAPQISDILESPATLGDEPACPGRACRPEPTKFN